MDRIYLRSLIREMVEDVLNNSVNKEELSAYYIPHLNVIVFHDEGYEDEVIPIFLFLGAFGKDVKFCFDVDTIYAEDALYRLFGRKIQRILDRNKDAYIRMLNGE